jgi:uncharacterized caspase-like protein
VHHSVHKIAALVISVCVLASSAFAEKRIALVVGNADYEHTSALANPANDARTVSGVLTEQGFEVYLHLNADLKKMKRALAETANRARHHGKQSVVLFYFAGHGVQVKQSNYLIPVDAKIESEGDVDIEALNAASVLEVLSDAGAAINIVVLDACRNNPYRTSFRAPSRGLARMDGPPGFLVAFSTDPGKVASDGPTGSNSPYATALTQQLGRSGIKIEEAFKQVRREVYEVTKGAQVPWETSSLMDDLYIGPRSAEAKALSETAAVTSQQQAALRAKAAKAQAEAEAERLRLQAEITKAEAAKLRAKTEAERARAEADQAAAEAAKAQAEAQLAKAQAEANRVRATASIQGPVASLGTPSQQSNSVPSHVVDHITRYIERDFLNDREQYDTYVDYYDKGIVDRSTIIEDKRKYALRWPDRTYTLVPGSLSVTTIGPNEYSVTYSFQYFVRNGAKQASGNGRQTVRIKQVGQSFFVRAAKASVNQ